ncbi:hypothetical protein JJJ17_03555 [Paracoccus caeni]|uniref:Magnesium transporter MgtE intracellular domain-containing protein n=1 Tax=Paracoccus caeni TaxID=657651 RepID=A0A934VXI0_9RHOB|nr:hypothetical protein [Paracoccus caeni]MBK4214997.1 hypothetical protein [Paracoccus caeni]
MRRLLPLMGLCFTLPAVATLWHAQGVAGLFAAFADPPGLLQGCSDVPEAVTLVKELQDRRQRVERYLEVLDEKRAEIAEAERAITARLVELRTVRDGIRSSRNTETNDIAQDIDRLVAVYDQMKPAEAAAILTNLPPHFAAEILMRVQPQNGARIIASVEPQQAALLTAQMGARSIPHP